MSTNPAIELQPQDPWDNIESQPPHIQQLHREGNIRMVGPYNEELR
jgi:hypothetical protein